MYMKNPMHPRFVKLIAFALLAGVLHLSGCGEEGGDEPAVTGPPPVSITINLAQEHQRMVGFGGALTWYSNWLTSNSQKNQIYDLIFDDLGIDIIRFKTWYYPDGYPDVTSTAVMSDDNSRAHWEATNELYFAAKARKPDVKIMLSSWGPPAALKSNNSTRMGTLARRGDGSFMYDEYALYWERTLAPENLPFNPDYISIQNEPTFITSGWTTCEWSHRETATLPDYHIAFDKVHERIRNRPNAPVMIGPESQDIPTYFPFAGILKDKPHCGALAYHPYNINANTSQERIVQELQSIGQFSRKPNMMTEFSDNIQGWFNTARFIQNCLIHANSDSYIYWKLVWAVPSGGNPDVAMVSVRNAAASFNVTPFYHTLKHFSKYVDFGFVRVAASTPSPNLIVSAFRSVAGNQLTVIILNHGTTGQRIDFGISGRTFSRRLANQSTEGSFFQTIELTDGTPITAPAQSLTTVVLDVAP
jgi:glucuronoarabinoxylan endo-1,4-beta-xylanase